MDNDNLIKPIQDSLQGLIYRDDRQIVDTQIRKTDINGAFRVRGVSLLVLEGFSRGDEFLHVRIEAPPDHADLLG